MVAGTLTGREIDFPDAPVNGDEFQAPNKFVYEWNDDNRWKNIHRTLVIPDYVWPDPTDPDNPYGPDNPNNPNPNPDGGGGDDWTVEEIQFPVNNGEATITIDARMNADYTLTDQGFGDACVAHISDFVIGLGAGSKTFINDPIAKLPLIACNGISAGPNDRNVFSQDGPDLDDPFAVSDLVAGDKYASFRQTVAPEFNSAWLSSWGSLQELLSEKGYENKTEVRFRIRSSASYIGGAFPSFWCYVSANQYGNTQADSINGSSVVDFYNTYGLNSYSDGLQTATGSWVYFDEDTEFISIESRFGGGYEVGDIYLEIDDPYASGDRSNLPVGFATTPEATYSVVAFAGTSGPIFRSIKHTNPASLSGSQYDQFEDGTDGYLDVTDGSSYTMDWTCLWLREDNNFYITVDSKEPNVVQSRHLYTPGDFSTHSVVVSGSYDFKDYAGRTPDLGFAIRNIHMNPDGNLLFVMDTNGELRSYPVSTPWDLTSVDENTYTELDIDPDWGATAFDITQDGLVIVLVKAGKGKQLIMNTAWDLTTVYDSGFERDFEIDNPIDICVSADTESIMILDVPTDVDSAYSIFNYRRNIR